MDGSVNEWMKYWMNGWWWLNKWMNGWGNEWMKYWIEWMMMTE